MEYQYLSYIEPYRVFWSCLSGAIAEEDIERFKQAFARPGSMTAALNYYRAIIDAATWAAPTTKRHDTLCWQPLGVALCCLLCCLV